MLGERESGTARLKDAVAAFLSALEENTRDRVPLEWAGTQNNLGFTLWRLGERETGTSRLEAAVVAYHAALEEHTRERVPMEWARTQANLGLALTTLGERESDAARLRQAEAAMQSAYVVYQEAGYDHYNDDFKERLCWLRQRIEADRNADSPCER
jgi:tetratricopeptide (TPR) repeat protein